jgi:hypothetical protein
VTWIVYVCHSAGRWARQNIEVPLNRVCATCTGLSVSKTAMLLGFIMINSFPFASGMVHHPKDMQPTSHSCGKHWRQLHPCGTPCRVHALANWGCSEGKRECNSILGMESIHPLDFFHILLGYSHIPKLIKKIFFLINLHTIPHNDKAKQVFRNVC